ncbi:hypothetical protein GWI33_006300 [Rhynchophorus ferrugineus]|uniref:Nose resistant-to-fluoxetine protein N-terminal domain-containing protein n=1 Tax=Rhynchophorus ferrugineus TaxID=354439 RepID=A0A834IM48_RHYFE|nr:hypothetical protein GWI33_006300 [Rhynchophorus ferrugineus]
MTHAWYLPCDFHYFIIAIGICILIKKEKKIGLSALFSVIIISMVIPFILTVAYSRPAMLLFYPDFLTGPKTHPDFLLTYSKSHTRATPYFMGMVAGYIYYKLKGKNNHVCRFKTTLIVLASLLSIVASIFCGAIFYNPYHEYNTYESAAYAALHRPLWAMGSIGLMYVASYGHASFLSTILTWNPWIPLSKLQYGAYLVHMQFQLRAAAKFMSPRYISFFDLISLSLSDIVLAFITALCLYLMIEAPLRKIFKELLNPKREPKKPKTDVEEAAATENPESTAHYDNPAFVSPNNSDDTSLAFGVAVCATPPNKHSLKKLKNRRSEGRKRVRYIIVFATPQEPRLPQRRSLTLSPSTPNITRTDEVVHAWYRSQISIDMQLWLEVFGVLTCICAIQAQNSIGRNQYVRENVDIFPPLPLGVIDGKNVLCRDQTRLYIDHLRNMSLWAYEIRDSTAKSANGLLRGGIAQFGQFEECLSVNAPFATQYCVATIVANVPVPNPPRDPKSLIYNPNESVLRKIYDKNDPAQQAENVALLGWCIPASCTAEDLQEYLNEYLSTVDSQLRTENVSYIASIGGNACQAQNDNRTLDQIDISFLLVTLIILLLLIASTICDIMWTDEGKLGGDSPTRRLLVSFSIKKNYPKLSKSEDSNPALRVLYGMRVICICMIITDHRFGTFLSNAIMNFNEVEEQYRSTFGTLFFHGDLFVDSFFILSGILVTYCLLVQFEKRILNPGFIILMRYIRLTPMYAYVIYFCATIFYFVGHGPMWKTIIAPEVQDCRDNWWTSVLYISNYVNAEHMCMVHSWYLPCDFHYFIVAIFLCILINKRKKAGLIALAVLFVVSILIPFIIVFVNNRPAVLFFYLDFIRSPKSHPDFLLTYVKSHARSTPYFVGIVAGYLFYRSRNQKVRLNWKTETQVPQTSESLVFHNPL